MAKYHVNERGEAGVCRARKACPFGDLEEDHFPSAEAARSFYEASMKASTFTRATPSMLTTEDVLRMDEERQRLLMGAVGRLRLDESPWGEDTRRYWQAAYDTTEAGRLWLDRKRRENKGSEREHPEVAERTAAVERFLAAVEEEPMRVELPEDPGAVLDRELPPVGDHVFQDRSAMGEQKTKLALLSAAWMSNLSSEEIEAVSWVTSNGASVMNHHLNGQEPEIWGYKTYPKHFINQQLRFFRSAMAKAPELEEPVVIYRGTGASHAEVSYLDRPASASASGAVAKGFRNGEGEEVLLEIKTKKVPSVAGMSAWGVGELEVLAPLGHYRKVGEFTAMRGVKADGRGFRKADIEPEFDEIRVVQLEYVGTD